MFGTPTSGPLCGSIEGRVQVAVISAMAAIVGSSVGALATFATTWLVQNSQLQSQRLGSELAKRERLYADFIAEAAKRMTDAMSHEVETPDVLVVLAASIGQMRLFSSSEVITAAEVVARAIVDSYIAPNRNLKELRESFMDESRLDPLGQFADACRKELGGMTA
jgi:hypothetical protein